MSRFANLGRTPHAAVWLLAALGLLFVITPFVEDLPRGDLVETGLLTLVMTFGVLALEARGRTLAVALLLVLPALAAKWANHVQLGLCSVGYGDVIPVSKIARTCAIVEAISGLFYVAVFISRLVAIYSANTPADTTPPAPDHS